MGSLRGGVCEGAGRSRWERQMLRNRGERWPGTT